MNTRTLYTFTTHMNNYADRYSSRISYSQGNSDFGAGPLKAHYNVKKASECDGTIHFSPSGLVFEIVKISDFPIFSLKSGP